MFKILLIMFAVFIMLIIPYYYFGINRFVERIVGEFKKKRNSKE